MANGKIQTQAEEFRVLRSQVTKKKEMLWNSWTEDTKEELRRKLLLALQEVESETVFKPSLNISIEYQLGSLAGFVEFLEKIYNQKSSQEAIADIIRKGPKANLVLKILYENGEMNHGDLAKAIDSSYSSLTGIMKKVLLSGAAEAIRYGKYTTYRLTEEGTSYYLKHKSNDDLLSKFQEIVQSAINKALIAQSEKQNSYIPEQKIGVSDTVFWNCDNQTHGPMIIEKIIRVGDNAIVNTIKKDTCTLEQNEADIRVGLLQLSEITA